MQTSKARFSPVGLQFFTTMDPDKTMVLDRTALTEALVREGSVEPDTARQIAFEIKEELDRQEASEVTPRMVKRILDAKLVEYGFKPPLKLSENAITVLERRYLRKNEQGDVIETPEEMFQRVAHAMARADELYGRDDAWNTEAEFYSLMTTLQFIPNSPTLMNAGRELGQLSACFVLPVEDSMESIFDAIKNTALIHKSGGGTGFSFSRIRPTQDVVASTKGVSSGPISFMRVFDIATETIKQGGTRRGANMGILSVSHPDILSFIKAKTEQHLLNNFNISIALTDAFMAAVEADTDYDLINPRTGLPAGKMHAREVLDLIVDQAWMNGEPGIIFIDRINDDNPTPHIGRIESTNPCGEQPLLPYESCNLGSINLALMVRDGRVDFDKLKNAVHTSVHFLDNVIDMNRYPLPEIERMTRGNRKIGLGVMGFADMLVKLGIPYDSEDALHAGEDVMAFIDNESKKASETLSAERGVFPNYQGSIHDRNGGMKLRNATTTTIAPTGTISIIAGASSGIEPIYAVAFTRNVMDKDELPEVNPLFYRMAKEGGFYSDELMREIAKKGSVQDIAGVPEKVRRLFRTALDISPEWHVRMQAVFQKHTDNAVSKTVNLPHEATRENVAQIYRLAYRLGTKGITVYRDGSRSEQVLSIGTDKAAAPVQEKTAKIVPRERPDVMSGTTQKIKTGCGNLYVTINEDEQGPFEVFTTMGKAGGCSGSQAESISRMISLGLRAGIDMDIIRSQLMNIKCPNEAFLPGGNGRKIQSCADAIAYAMESHIRRKGLQQGDYEDLNAAVQAATAGAVAPVMGKTCPICNSPLIPQEGCLKCMGCNWTKCG
jgi:ribonucleoside-diphosphate reductase alpha chain